jgi:hypothetical protein
MQSVRRSRGAQIAALAGTVALVLAGCRGILGVDERPNIVEDAGVDAGAEDADAAPPGPTFCDKLNPPAQHCSDFETGDLRKGWDQETKLPDPGVHGGGILEELRDPAGRMLLASTPALTADGQKAGANLFLTLPVRPTRVMVQADMNVITEEHVPANEALLMQVVFGNEGAVVVYRDSQGAAVLVTPDGKGARFPFWPLGSKHRVSISVDNAPVRGADGFAEAAIDGALGPELIVPAHFQKAGPPIVVIGVRTFAPVGPMKVAIDDIAIYWTPSK